MVSKAEQRFNVAKEKAIDKCNAYQYKIEQRIKHIKTKNRHCARANKSFKVPEYVIRHTYDTVILVI